LNEQRDIATTNEAPVLAEARGRNLIAVIGIDRYQRWRPLSNAVNDARAAMELFERLGFAQATEALIDGAATARAIQALVIDDLVTLSSDDSLVLFYAGHGGNRRHRVGNRDVMTGYLIAVDSDDRVSTWVELEAWLRAVALLPAKHILVILDACHSGIALDPVIKWRDGTSWRDETLATLKERRSRRIIASALGDQRALDAGPYPEHSLFTGCLIEALTTGLRRSDKPVITGSELGVYLQRRVASYPRSQQTPDLGTFAFDERGEMLIPVMGRPPMIAEMIDDVGAQHSQSSTVSASDASIIRQSAIEGRLSTSARSSSASSKLIVVLVLTILGVLALIVWMNVSSSSGSAPVAWPLSDKSIAGSIPRTRLSVEMRPMLQRDAGGATVLWIDDHPENNAVERELLEESLSLKFILATSNAGELEQIKLYSPDLIISDMTRAKDLIAGYALLDSLQRQGVSIPVIIYAGSCLPERRAEARRLGAFGCTARPSELREYVRVALSANPP
jgi:CheY-like chemotaxis protein